MSLMNEIAALRSEINAAQARGAHAEERVSAPPVQPAQDVATQDQHDIEKLLEMLNATLDEFADEIDKFPRLTALAALGVGLAFGVVIGRRLR